MPPLLQVDNLKIRFKSHDRVTEAVKGISFKMEAGRTLAVVGESGSGKSVTALSLTRLLPSAPVCEISGSALLNGENLFTCSQKSLRKIRGKQIAYIFQEPGTSLNPVFSIGYQIAEAVHLHRPDVKDVHAHVIQALDRVGIRSAEKRYNAYPHEMSGGMQQRVMIAMALACEPQLLIADEPTTALDVTIQKQIMDLLKSLKAHTNMSVLLITHNFGIVKDFADDVLVMYRGEIVEQGTTESILAHPRHFYTRALIQCIPRLGKKQRRLTTIESEMLGNDSVNLKKRS